MKTVTSVSKGAVARAANLTRREARMLVATYNHEMSRKAVVLKQINAIKKSGGTCDFLEWLVKEKGVICRQIGKGLKSFAEGSEQGRWALSITGIGPVIAAACVAYLDVTKAPTAGHFWSFCGVHTGVKWEKGKTRPWCKTMKQIAYKIGKSFAYFQNHPLDVYGKILAGRKAYEIERDARGEYKTQADALAPRFRKTTKAYGFYSQGHLAPAHIQMRAQRYAAKLFLAHLHEVWYRIEFGTAPPKPYPIAHLEHTDLIAPPMTGLVDAPYERPEEEDHEERED